MAVTSSRLSVPSCTLTTCGSSEPHPAATATNAAVFTMARRTFATKTRPVQKKKASEGGVDVHTALKKLRESARAKFDESVEIAVHLNVDTRKSDQNVRGAVELPHGTGKAVKVAVFAKDAKAEEAVAAGADYVGGADLADRIKDGFLDFNRCIATPDMMGQVAQVARILGPKGLMPNPKLGTITTNVEAAIASAKRGQAVYRAERNGIIHASIGKLSFTDQQLIDNLKALQLALLDARPKSAPKGVYFKAAHLSTTMGPGVLVDNDRINPQSKYFLMQPSVA